MTEPSHPVPSTARVVIIGGGIAGTSVAYHLAKLGWTEVVLLEQNDIAAGTTWHAAGMVTRLRTSGSMMKVNQATADLYGRLAAESGHDPHWRQVGSLVMARTPDRMTQIRRTTAMAGYLGVQSEIITGRDVTARWPVVRGDDLVGAAWIPDDGRVNPADAAIALSKAAAARGVKIVTGVRVTDLLHKAGRVAGVTTQHGTVTAELVVLCGGMWSRQLAGRVGVNLPAPPGRAPLRRQQCHPRRQWRRPLLPRLRRPDLLPWRRPPDRRRRHARRVPAAHQALAGRPRARRLLVQAAGGGLAQVRRPAPRGLSPHPRA